MVVKNFRETAGRRRDNMRTPASDSLEVTVLIDWLNLKGDSNTARAQRKVEDAIRLLREMDRLRSGKSRKGMASEKLKLYDQARLRLVRLAPAKRPLRVLPTPAGHHAYYPDSRTPLQYGFELLSGISRRGWLDLLLQCRRKSCGKWFIRKRRNNAFCSADCQQDYWFEYRKTPKGLEEERLRMRRLREQRGREAKSLKKGETMKRPKKLPRGVFIKDSVYYIRYADQRGKIRREMSGPFLEQAKRAVEKRRSEVRDGKFFPERIRQRCIMFAEIAKDYLDSMRKSKKRDKSHDEQRGAVLLEALKDEPIGELTPARLDAVLAELGEESEWAPATHNRYRALLSGIFRQAIRNKKALFNPVRETKHFKEFPRERFLSEEEQTELMAAIRKQCPEREAEVLVAIHSGMRRSEQYRTSQVPDGGLKWEYVNFHAGVIRWPRTKSGKPRTVPMNSVLAETLRAIPQRIDSPYVFEGEPDKWFAEICDSAGVKNFSWHGLRHTFGSRLALDGVPLNVIKELMGHSSIQVTERYAHLQPGHLADAVERLAHPQKPKSTAASGTAIDTSQNAASETEVKKAG